MFYLHQAKNKSVSLNFEKLNITGRISLNRMVYFVKGHFILQTHTKQKVVNIGKIKGISTPKRWPNLKNKSEKERS